MTLQRVVHVPYYCDHFRRYLTACTCHTGTPMPVTRREAFTIQLVALMLLQRTCHGALAG